MTGGRVSVYFSIRYFTPIMVLLAVAASTTHPNVDRLTGLLTAQIALAVATHAMAARGGSWVGRALDLAGPLAPPLLLACIALGVLLMLSRGSTRLVKLDVAGLARRTWQI